MTTFIINGTPVAVAVVPATATDEMASAAICTTMDADLSRHVHDIERDAITAAATDLARACEAAAKTFRWYEKLHAAKTPEVGASKAARNRAEAEKLESALSRITIQETSDAG